MGHHVEITRLGSLQPGLYPSFGEHPPLSIGCGCECGFKIYLGPKGQKQRSHLCKRAGTPDVGLASYVCLKRPVPLLGLVVVAVILWMVAKSISHRFESIRHCWLVFSGNLSFHGFSCGAGLCPSPRRRWMFNSPSQQGEKGLPRGAYHPAIRRITLLKGAYKQVNVGE